MAKKKVADISKKKGVKISDILKIEVKGNPGILFLSEVGFDSEFFNETAWQNLLKFINFNADIKAVLIDGAVSRLDRPEFLTAEKLLTYWTTPRSEAEKISEEIKNYEQYSKMVGTQMEILEERLSELKEKCPQVQVILSGHTDSLQSSCMAMLNELLLIKQESIEDELRTINSRVSKNKDVCRGLKAQKAKAAGKKLAKLETQLQKTELAIETDKAQRESKYAEQKLYRVKKVRPMHQVMTRELTEATFAQYRQLCNKLGYHFISESTIFMVNNLVVDYAHSRHYTWNVMKDYDERLLSSFFGRMDSYLKKSAEATGGNKTDIVVESHHGTGCKHTRRIKYQSDSLNFTDISKYDSNVVEEYLSFLVLPTFEDQEKVAEFLKGKRADRLGPSGKPMNTRSNPAIDRYRNDGKTGIAIITKGQFGLGIQFISYKRILSGSALNQPKNYFAIFCSSDEHIMHPAEDPLARRGLLSLYEKCLKEDFDFRGKKARACGYINAGDVGEANHEAWKHHPDHKLSAEEVLNEAINLATDKPKNDDELLQRTMKIAQLGMQGSAGNMTDVLNNIGDYLMGFLKPGLKHSELKYLLCIVPGNHIANILSRHGLKEFALFMARLKDSGVKAFEAGISGASDQNTDSAVRVALGGYEVCLALYIEQYGLSKDNEVMFGPIRLFLAHDPKGNKKTGLTGADKKTGANLAIAGHTHETWVQLTKCDDNDWGVAFRVATLQKVTATEIKYADTLPRTGGAHIIIMPDPGDFSEFFLDLNFLRKLGKEDIEVELKKIIAEKSGK
ncbi:MAG: hypothetical protein WC459_01200 [Patescibacteria group bacterium]